MSDIVKRKCHSFDNPALSLEGGGLWRYVPVSNSDNKAFCDFMVLLPGIKKNRTLQVMIRHQLQEVLKGFGDQIIFADLNLHLGLVWVTVTPEPGLCSDVAEAIHSRVDGARVVGSYVKRSKTLKISWMDKVKRLLT